MNRSILVVAEGEHELSVGRPDAALMTLVHRLLGDGFELSTCGKRIRELSGHIHPGRGDRLGRKFIGIIQYAERQGYHAVVILMDHDGYDSRPKSASFAQEATVISLPRAVGIAVRSFDAWFLADHAALSTVLRSTVDKQPDPETLSDPKKRCQTLNETANSCQPLRDVYSMVAAITNLQILRERCPIGFAVFAERVESLKTGFSNKT